jgi:hypothetical protein
MYTQITSSESMHMKKWTDQTPKEEELKTNAVLGTEFSSSMTHLHGEISSSISWRSARHEAQCQALRPVRRGFYSTEEVPSTRGSLLPLFPAEAQPQERGGRCSRGAEASPSATTSGEACGRPYGICSARNRLETGGWEARKTVQVACRNGVLPRGRGQTSQRAAALGPSVASSPRLQASTDKTGMATARPRPCDADGHQP